jgi:hypothetical protein
MLTVRYFCWIVRARDLVQKYLIALRLVRVKRIAFQRDDDRLLKFFLVEPFDDNGDFVRRAAVEGVQQFAVFQKHSFFVFFGSDGVAYILKAERLGKLAARRRASGDKETPSSHTARTGITSWALLGTANRSVLPEQFC